MPAERDFTDVVLDLDDGKVHQALTLDLRKLVEAVQETSRSGAITLTLKVKSEGRQVSVVGEVKVKTPKPSTMATLFFVDKGQDLTREDPLQQPLRFPPRKPAKEPININAPTPASEKE